MQVQTVHVSYKRRGKGKYVVTLNGEPLETALITKEDNLYYVEYEGKKWVKGFPTLKKAYMTAAANKFRIGGVRY